MRSFPNIAAVDRKSTRLNSSHVEISYAVFCLKKKKMGVCHRHPLVHRPPVACFLAFVSTNLLVIHSLSVFFFNDTATTEIYTLSLHDALPIWPNIAALAVRNERSAISPPAVSSMPATCWPDRKSTRLNSSHVEISYAVFCLKKKKTKIYDSLTSKKKKNTTQTI